MSLWREGRYKPMRMLGIIIRYQNVRHLDPRGSILLNRNGLVYLVGFLPSSYQFNGQHKCWSRHKLQAEPRAGSDFVLYSLNIAESCNTSFLMHSMLQYVSTGFRTDVGLTVNHGFKSTLSCFPLPV